MCFCVCVCLPKITDLHSTFLGCVSPVFSEQFALFHSYFYNITYPAQDINKHANAYHALRDPNLG